MLTHQELTEALERGSKVHWQNRGYLVYKDGYDRTLVTYQDNGYTNYLLESDLEHCFIGDLNAKV